MSEENKKENKNNNGVKGLLIILIILMSGVLVLLGYKLFFSNKENKVTENNTNISEDNTKADTTNTNDANIPIKDSFASYVTIDVPNENNVLVYSYVLKNGIVYETKKSTPKNDYHTYSYPRVPGEPQKTGNLSVSEIKGLPTIKRIKGITNIGSSIDADSLLLVAENGEVYTYNIYSSSIRKAPKLDGYKVDDITSYYVTGACSVDGPCPVDITFIDQDGKTQHINQK